MVLGLSIAVVSALGTSVSALFKARGARVARPVQVHHPLRSAADLFRSRWFAIGWILALIAWGLHDLAFCLVIAGAAFMPAPVRTLADQRAQQAVAAGAGTAPAA